MRNILENISRLAARVTGWVVTALAACLAGSILISIFFRYVMGSALSWPEEVALLLFTWLVLLAGSLGVRLGFHVRLSIFTDRLPRIPRLCLDRLVTAGIIAFGAVLAYSGVDLVERTHEHLSAVLRYPLDWLNYAGPVAGCLIVLHGLNHLARPWGDEQEVRL